MNLTTNRLLLRDYTSHDWERVHLYASEPEFSKYEFWGPNSVEDTQKFITDMVHQSNTASRFRFDLAICLREKDLLIGGCGIRRETELSQVANLGWAVK